jgi:hypothetical protein
MKKEAHAAANKRHNQKQSNAGCGQPTLSWLQEGKRSEVKGTMKQKQQVKTHRSHQISRRQFKRERS